MKETAILHAVSALVAVGAVFAPSTTIQVALLVVAALGFVAGIVVARRDDTDSAPGVDV
jgi:hypothetical protein